MIIVNQDRDKIINFENIDRIYIENPLENNDGEFEIKAENEWINERIGCYKTEHRAKEILKEIYKYKDDLEHTKFLGYTEAFWKSTTFEMPEK